MRLLSHVPVCIGALVALYLCLVVVVVIAARPHETFKFDAAMSNVNTPDINTDINTDINKPDINTDINKPDIDTSAVSVGTPLTSSTTQNTRSRQRMVRSLQATVTDDKDAQLELDDALFAPYADWMRQDAQYLMRDVLPVYKRLIQTKTLFDGESDTVGRKHRCPKVSSTDKLMGNQSRVMYECAETALLRVLPAMNQPITMDSSPPASEEG